MNSQKVLSALDYCSYGFDRCEIYIRHLKEEYLKHVQDGNNNDNNGEKPLGGGDDV